MSHTAACKYIHPSVYLLDNHSIKNNYYYIYGNFKNLEVYSGAKLQKMFLVYSVRFCCHVTMGEMRKVNLGVPLEITIFIRTMFQE